MAQVLEAKDLFLNRTVAIKIARTRSNAGSILRKEGQALAAIRHPGLVTIFGMGQFEDIDYLVMERIYGDSLETVIEGVQRGARKLPIAEVVDILTRIAEAL